MMADVDARSDFGSAATPAHDPALAARAMVSENVRAPATCGPSMCHMEWFPSGTLTGHDVFGMHAQQYIRSSERRSEGLTSGSKLFIAESSSMLCESTVRVPPLITATGRVLAIVTSDSVVVVDVAPSSETRNTSSEK